MIPWGIKIKSQGRRLNHNWTKKTHVCHGGHVRRAQWLHLQLKYTTTHPGWARPSATICSNHKKGTCSKDFLLRCGDGRFSKASGNTRINLIASIHSHSKGLDNIFFVHLYWSLCYLMPLKIRHVLKENPLSKFPSFLQQEFCTLPKPSTLVHGRISSNIINIHYFATRFAFLYSLSFLSLPIPLSIYIVKL